MIFRRKKTDLPNCEANLAIERAKQAKRDSDARWEQVREVSGMARLLKQQNGFIQGFRDTLRGKT